MVSVDPDFTVIVYPSKIYKNLPPRFIFRNNKSLSVPPRPARKISCTAVIVFTEGAFNAPVVREINKSPLRIVQPCFLAIRNIPLKKSPAGVKILNRSAFRLSLDINAYKKQHQEEGNLIIAFHDIHCRTCYVVRFEAIS